METGIFNMLNRKISVKRSYLIVVWFVIYCAKMLIGGFCLIDLLAFFMGYPLPFPIYKSDGIWLTITFLFIITIWMFWNKATFSQRDFIKLTKYIGIRFIKWKFFPRWYDDLSHIYSYGLLEDIHIATIIDSPSSSVSTIIYGSSSMERYKKLESQLFHSFQNETTTPEINKENTPLQPSGAFKSIEWGKVLGMAYLYEESRIELFSLIKGPCNVDVKIKIEDDEKDVPATDCPEIDKILRASLSDVKHFYARLIFNKDCLRMTIIGGSWEGEKFRQKILKGFEIFQAMNNELRKKYTVGSWDSWDVKWDKKGNFFYLAPKEGQA